MDIGLAIKYLKQGKKVTRAGWNSKGMWLILVPGSRDIKTGLNTPYRDAGLKVVSINPHIDMYTAEGCMQPGWTLSQVDMLADDWETVL
jgi:hypothetical protein